MRDQLAGGHFWPSIGYIHIVWELVDRALMLDPEPSGEISGSEMGVRLLSDSIPPEVENGLRASRGAPAAPKPSCVVWSDENSLQAVWRMSFPGDPFNARLDRIIAS